MKIGILAFGSLIDDPGEEIANVIFGDPIAVETPFPVEISQRGRALIIDILSSGGARTNLADGIGAPTSPLASLKHHAEEDLSVPNGWKKIHGCKMKSCVENQIGEIILEA